MLITLCKEIHKAGVENTIIPESVRNHSGIIGYKNYLDLFYYAGSINFNDLNFITRVILLINDIENIKYIETIETRFTEILNQVRDKTPESKYKMLIIQRAISILEQEHAPNTLTSVIKFIILSWILDAIDTLHLEM
jgi:hypothetical protein